MTSNRFLSQAERPGMGLELRRHPLAEWEEVAQLAPGCEGCAQEFREASQDREADIGVACAFAEGDCSTGETSSFRIAWLSLWLSGPAVRSHWDRRIQVLWLRPSTTFRNLTQKHH